MPELRSATAVRPTAQRSGSNREPSRPCFMRAGPIALTFSLASAVAAVTPAGSAQAATPTCHGASATIVATSPGTIHGTPGRDVIVGSSGNDTILAGRGNDLICGGDGADRLFGGPGNDRLYGERDLLANADEDGIEREGDTLDGGPGNDHLIAGVDTRAADITFPDTYSWNTSTHGVHIDLRTHTTHGDGTDTIAAGTANIVGSAHGDVFDGSNHRDLIFAGYGPDVVRGHGGNDWIEVDGRQNGPGSDTDEVWGGDGKDRITSSHGQDHINGGPGNDYLETSGRSNDVVTGGTGNDFYGAEMGDTQGPQNFNGGPGDDGMQVNTDAINPKHAASTGTYNMQTGKMTFTLDHPISLTVHVEGVTIATRGTSWTVTGTPGDDGVSMGMEVAGSVFNGLAGDDTFNGSDHDDVFNGGPGTDTAQMWDGDDTCISVEKIGSSGCEHIS
jgi:Ca2+-binding RTX toxin-like protein